MHAKVDTEETLLRRTVREALVASKWDYEKATAPFMERVDASEALTRQVLLEGARYLLRQGCYMERERYATGTDGSPAPYTSSSSHIAPAKSYMRIVANNWYDFPLPNNLGRLGSATRATFKQLVEFYGVRESGMRRWRKFYEDLGKATPEDQCAEKVLTPIQIARLASKHGIRKEDL